MNKTIYIPLDNRPCTYQFPAKIAEIAGYQVILPPRDNMGDVTKACKLSRLDSWLGGQLPQAERLILSLDTWIYGGLVSSRITTEAFEKLQTRLVQLKQIKLEYPNLKLHGFITLLRISNANDSTEERSYWVEYGQQIYRLSYLDDYLSSGHFQEDLVREWEELKASIPQDIVKDYKQLRLRNFQMIKLALQLVKENTLDSLVIGYDDGGAYGWNVMERRELEQLVKSDELEHKIFIYPGADEIGSTLAMRTLISQVYKVYIVYSFPNHKRIKTRYEGIPLEDTVQFQMKAAGCLLVNDWQEADAILWIHNPKDQQFDQFLQREQVHPEDNTHLLHEISALLKQDKKVVFADVKYANGGDYHLVSHMSEAELLFKFCGYTAWNTTGNTLGMALAWLKASLKGLPDTKAIHYKFLLERYIDDGLYQGYLRQKLSEHFSDEVTMEHALSGLTFFQKALSEWQPQLNSLGIKSAQIETFQFPWNRFFEAEFDVRLDIQ